MMENPNVAVDRANDLTIQRADRPEREMADLFPSRVDELKRECSLIHETITALVDVLSPIICQDRMGVLDAPAEPVALAASPLMGVLEDSRESVMRARHRIEQLISAVTV